MRKDWWRQHALECVLIILAVLFFVVYSWHYASTLEQVNTHGFPAILNSPDETANAFFIQHFSEFSNLKVVEPLNTISDQIIHPRSVNARGNTLVPITFLGIFAVYGYPLRALPSWALYFFTPFLAAVAGLFFYSIVKQIFGKPTAFLATLLFWTHPAYWYYASRGLLPNVLFVDLVILGMFFLLNKVLRPRFLSFFFAGIFLSLALLVRPSEVVWVVFIILILGIFHFRKIRCEELLCFGIPLLIFSFLFLKANQAVYGHALITGYESASILNRTETQAFGLFPAEILKNLFSPFGFHPRLILQNIFFYGVVIQWWYVILLLPGMIFLVKNMLQKHKLSCGVTGESLNEGSSGLLHAGTMYLFLFFSISIFLFQFYGSWLFFDNINRHEITIGNSLLRYWLPISLFSLPLIAYGLIQISERISKPILRWIFLCLMFGIVMGLSARTVLFSSEESLLSVNRAIANYYTIREKVDAAIEPEAILLVDRADKIFWPGRRVVSYLGNPEVFSGTRKLIEQGFPVYYYLHTELADDLLRKLTDETLPAHGLMIEEYQRFSEGDFLYRFIVQP